jgi:O-antigen ligase
MQSAGAAAYAARVLAVTTGLVAGGLLIVALLVDGLGPLQLWYGAIRFRGWAENPNQLALLVAAAPFVSIHFALRARTRIIMSLFVGCALLSFAAGIATTSDALIVSWCAAAALLLVALWKDVILRGSRHMSVLVANGVLMPTLLAAILVLYGHAIYDIVADVLFGIYAFGDQGSVRLSVWQNALAAWERSPVVGLGPGSYSGYSGPFEGTEAHNTLLDWSASAGTLGLVLLLLLYGGLVTQLLRSRARILLLALTSILTFSLFHYVMRQPLFWVWLVLLYQLAVEDSRIELLGNVSVRSDPERDASAKENQIRLS